MTPRLMDVLVPALSVALASGAAVGLGASPALTLGVAVLASAAGGWLRLRAQPGRLPRTTTHQRVPSADAAPGHVQALLDALPVGVLVVARDRTLKRVNRGAGKVFRLPATGPHPAAVLRAPPLLQAIAAGFRTGEPATVDFSLPRAGAEHLRAHLRPLGGGDIAVAIEDRTEAHRASRLHRDFVADASHELKTPLAALSGLVETLLGAARDDPAATAQFLDMLAAQTGRMTRLVEDLLSLNRIEQNERVHPREPQDLAAIVAEAVEALQPSADAARVTLRLEPPEGTLTVPGDRGELGQLVRNLLENAISYGGEGPEVTVLLSGPKPEHPGTARLAVRDTGPGIAPEHIPRLTERFYRVSASRSREKGGTGLGLAIVKHIVARHRGRLEIESRPGEGSCFTVWLPLAEEGAATSRN